MAPFNALSNSWYPLSCPYCAHDLCPLNLARRLYARQIQENFKGRNTSGQPSTGSSEESSLPRRINFILIGAHFCTGVHFFQIFLSSPREAAIFVPVMKWAGCQGETQ